MCSDKGPPARREFASFKVGRVRRPRSDPDAEEVTPQSGVLHERPEYLPYNGRLGKQSDHPAADWIQSLNDAVPAGEECDSANGKSTTPRGPDFPSLGSTCIPAVPGSINLPVDPRLKVGVQHPGCSKAVRGLGPIHSLDNSRSDKSRCPNQFVTIHTTVA